MTPRTRFTGPLLLVLTQMVAACSSAPPPRPSTGAVSAETEKPRIKTDAVPITPTDAPRTLEELYVKPRPEQLPLWRQWARSESVELRREALEQLAWLKDPEGVALAIAALGELDEGVRAAAATALCAYGSPMADRAKPALLAALKTAGPASQAPIAWALVELGDATGLAEAMELYRAGHLSQVQRLGGGVAFAPAK